MKSLCALFAGILFGFGLAVSGMTDTEKVIGFLNVFGSWDPDLIFVMGGAVVTTAIGFQLIFRASNGPLFNSKFSLPTNTVVDRKLLLGAMIFGVGWGLYGYCPGPAIASIIYLSPMTFIFIIAMLAGLFFGRFISNKMIA